MEVNQFDRKRRGNWHILYGHLQYTERNANINAMNAKGVGGCKDLLCIN